MTPQCWCGNTELAPFSPQYLKCPVCETLVTTVMLQPDIAKVVDDEHDFYGREYWFSHQEQDLGFTNITRRARTDLPERCLYWLQTTLKYKLPPGRALELGCAHGGFAALLKWAGFDATGLELSPWVVHYAHETFDIPMLLGPIEDQPLDPGSLDIIALMDVLEHLPDPAGTMRRCLDLLKPDGVLIIQTPRYPAGAVYEDMVDRKDPFLEQLKANQHLYLFSQAAVRDLFRRLGAEYLEFEPAMFVHYDMFLVVSRAPFAARSPDAIADALMATAHGRLALALLDLDDKFRDLSRRYVASEADRAARLEVIRQQGAELGRIHKLEADVAYLKDRLIASEADRAARLEVIQSQEQRMGALVAEHAAQLAEARSLLAQANIRTRIGIAVPYEIKRVRQLIDCTIQRLVSPAQVGDNGGAAAAASADVPAPGRAHSSPAASNGADAIQRIRDPKTTRPLEYNPEIIARIVEDLRARGFRVEELTLDPKEYRAYFEAADYTHLYSNYYTFNLPEKTLEHFIAAKMLELSPSDRYIDIASEHSPVPDIYTRLFGCVSYRQDLAYPAGLNGDRIGGDAAAMPVSDGFATKMALHCSFEHFEGESDMRFIREAERVLRGGGRACFAPLYLYHEYAILTDPAVAEQVPFEDDAVVYCKPGWHNRHGRFYDPLHLDRRIKSNLGTMQLTIYRVLNAAEVDPSCYIQFAAMVTKP